MRDEPLGGAGNSLDQQVELVAGQGRRCLGRAVGVDVGGVAGGFDVPPLVAEQDGSGHDDHRDNQTDEAAAAKLRGRLGAGWELRLAHGRGYDAGHRKDEEEAQQAEPDAHAALHLERGDGDGDDRDRRDLLAGCSVCEQAHLPGAVGHDPDGSGVEGRVGGGWFHDIGCGRVFGGLAGDGQRDDLEAGDGSAGAADLDRGDAGDDVGRADGDVEGVGAGVDGFEDVLGADVGEGCRSCEKQEEDEGQPTHQRCTLRIQSPKTKPAKALTDARNEAITSPVARCMPWATLSSWRMRSGPSAREL